MWPQIHPRIPQSFLSRISTPISHLCDPTLGFVQTGDWFRFKHSSPASHSWYLLQFRIRHHLAADGRNQKSEFHYLLTLPNCASRSHCRPRISLSLRMCSNRQAQFMPTLTTCLLPSVNSQLEVGRPPAHSVSVGSWGRFRSLRPALQSPPPCVRIPHVYPSGPTVQEKNREGSAFRLHSESLPWERVCIWVTAEQYPPRSGIF